MSLFLHLSSALVFFWLLHLLRTLLNERNFLRTLITGQRLCLSPLVFVRRFARLFAIELQVPRALQLPPAMVDAQFFLDFYRRYGIQSMLVFVDSGGNYVLRVIAMTVPPARTFPADVFGKALTVEVSSGND